MNNSSNVLKFYLLRVLICILFVVAFLLVLHVARPAEFGSTDFVQYWSAVQAYFQGQSSYDPFTIDKIQAQAGVRQHPILMWNPPYILPLFWWSFFLPFEYATTCWFLISLCTIALSLRLLVGNLKGFFSNKWFILFLITFYPIPLLLVYGQISGVLLLAFCAFIWKIKQSRVEICDSFVGGLCLGVGLIKPHLLWCIYLYILLLSVKKRRFTTVFGIGAMVLVLSLLTVVINPSVFTNYFNAWQQSPIYWKTPTVGSWMQELFKTNILAVRTLPTLLAILMYTGYFYFKASIIGATVENQIRDVKALVPFSLVLSPYGWVYDQVLILPLALEILGKKNTFLSMLAVSSNLIMLIFSNNIGQEWMVWYLLMWLVIASAF
jgi:hypothetical protein